MEERISCVEDTIEEIDISVKENVKFKNLLTENILEIWDTIKRPNLRRMLRRRGSVSPPRPRKHSQRNHRRKLSQPKGRDAYRYTRSL